MPAKDRDHDVVIRALAADGWRITHEQYAIVLPERRMWIDIRATRAAEERIILVEVKGFAKATSSVEYLSATLGQYLIYRVSLDYNDETTPIYLAVPNESYNGILSETLGQLVLQRFAIPLIVFDRETERIIRWIP